MTHETVQLQEQPAEYAAEPAAAPFAPPPPDAAASAVASAHVSRVTPLKQPVEPEPALVEITLAALLRPMVQLSYRVEDVFGELSATEIRLIALLLVEDQGQGVLQSRLQTELRITTHYTMTRACRNLVNCGAVTLSKRDPTDRRRQLLVLTERARALREELLAERLDLAATGSSSGSVTLSPEITI